MADVASEILLQPPSESLRPVPGVAKVLGCVPNCCDRCRLMTWEGSKRL